MLLSELSVNPTCIKVCSKEEYKLWKAGIKPPKPIKPYIAPHGKLMYLVKVSISYPIHIYMSK